MTPPRFGENSLQGPYYCGEPRRVSGEDVQAGISFELTVPCGQSSQDAIESYLSRFHMDSRRLSCIIHPQTPTRKR